MDREELLDILEENECLIAVGFNDALIGVYESLETVAVYDSEVCIKILVDRDGMDFDEAMQYFDFNVLGAFVGDKTPLFITLAKKENNLKDALKLINKN